MTPVHMLFADVHVEHHDVSMGGLGKPFPLANLDIFFWNFSLFCTASFFCVCVSTTSNAVNILNSGYLQKYKEKDLSFKILLIFLPKDATVKYTTRDVLFYRKMISAGVVWCKAEGCDHYRVGYYLITVGPEGLYYRTVIFVTDYKLLFHWKYPEQGTILVSSDLCCLCLYRGLEYHEG